MVHLRLNGDCNIKRGGVVSLTIVCRSIDLDVSSAAHEML